jgi:hypothetical protein
MYKFEAIVAHYGQGTEVVLIAGAFFDARGLLRLRYQTDRQTEVLPQKERANRSPPHPPNHHAGGAVFIKTGYQGGAYFLFTGNPTLAQIWVAGHSVDLRTNGTFSGALALRSGVTYFPAARAWKQSRCVCREG